MSWNQLDFEAESIALDKVPNKQVKQFAIAYLRLRSLPPLLARDRDSIQLVRVIVDHAESKLTIQELIARSNQGEYHNRQCRSRSVQRLAI